MDTEDSDPLQISGRMQSTGYEEPSFMPGTW